MTTEKKQLLGFLGICTLPLLALFLMGAATPPPVVRSPWTTNAIPNNAVAGNIFVNGAAGVVGNLKITGTAAIIYSNRFYMWSPEVGQVGFTSIGNDAVTNVLFGLADGTAPMLRIWPTRIDVVSSDATVNMDVGVRSLQAWETIDWTCGLVATNTGSGVIFYDNDNGAPVLGIPVGLQVEIYKHANFGDGFRVPAYGASVGFAWVCTNGTTGEGHWAAVTASSTNSTIGVSTNAVFASAIATNINFAEERNLYDTNILVVADVVDNTVHITNKLNPILRVQSIEFTGNGSSEYISFAAAGGTHIKWINGQSVTNEEATTNTWFTGGDWNIDGDSLITGFLTVSSNIYTTNVYGGAVYSGGTNLHTLAASGGGISLTDATNAAKTSVTVVSNAAGPVMSVMSSNAGNVTYTLNLDATIPRTNDANVTLHGTLTVKGNQTNEAVYANALSINGLSPGLAYFGNADTNLTNLAQGTAGQVLTMVGTTSQAWSNASSLGIGLDRQIGSAVLTNLAAAGITNWIGAGSVTLTTNAGAITFTGTTPATSFATNEVWNVSMATDSTVAITNTLGGSTAELYVTNVVDRKWFVARVLADGTARTITVTNLFAATFNVIATNGFSGVGTIPTVYVPANKLATIVGRAWVIAGTTNVDLFANVQP